jgi:hypothetical protein
MDKRPYGFALFAIGFGAVVACGGGGGGSAPVSPGTSTPSSNTIVISTPISPAATSTATAAATSIPTAVASITPGPVIASWAGINGFAATSPANFVPTFNSAQNEVGPPIGFTAIGQSVLVLVTQSSTGSNTPSSVSVSCLNNAVNVSNALNGPGKGSLVVSLVASTLNDPNCQIQISGALTTYLYPGPIEQLKISGP